MTKAIRSALARLEQADPDLGHHLRLTVRTGTFCTYAPDPALGIVWRDAPESPEPSADSRPPPPRRRSPTKPFVGRPLERRLVDELVAAAAAGRGGLLLVSGEAGIGKTRLAEEALAQAEERGMVTFVGRCLDAQPGLAWLPFVEVLDQLVWKLDDARLRLVLGGTGPEVAKVLPSLRRRLPDLPTPLDLPAEHARQFLYASIRDLLLRLGSVRPALVLLEDIHWADPATLNMLERLVDGLEDAKVLVVATYRSDEAAIGTPLARTLERLLRHPACARLILGRLDPGEVGELLAALTHQVPPPALASRLADEADGNPFFLEELVKHLGGLDVDLDRETFGVPDGLRLLLGHRLHTLSQACREVVDMAAVLGRSIDVDLLTAAFSDDDERCLDAVDEALAAGVLAVDPTGHRAGSGIQFRHALLRQAALDELSPVRGRRLHLRAADILRRLHGDDPAHAGEIADHLERGGAGAGAEAPTTVRYLELAGRRSLEAAAYEDAVDRFCRALELARAEDPLTRARLLAALGYAQRGLGDPDEANASWLRALELLEHAPAGDTALAAELTRGLGRYLDATGGLDRAVEVLERGMRITPATAVRERALLQAALGYAHTLAGDPLRAASCIDEASAVAEALDDDTLRADVLASRTALEFATGRIRACVDTAEAAEQALLGSGHPWDAVQAKVTTAWPRLWLGLVDDARRHAAETLATAERLGHVPAVFLARRSTALIDFVTTGELQPFSAHAVEGLEFCRAHRLRWLPDAHVFAGLAAFWAGDWDEAAGHLRSAATTAAPPIYAGRYSATLLTFLAWAGDGEAFDRLASNLHGTFAERGFEHTLGVMAVTLAEVEGHALLGRWESVARHYPAVLAGIADGIVLRPPDLRIVRALAGIAASASGDHDAAGGHFSEARALADALPHRRQVPDLDVLQALGALYAGDHAVAATWFNRAICGYDALGMPGHRARAEALARRSTLDAAT